MAPLIYHWAGGAYEKTARDLKDIYIRSDCIHSGKYDIPFRDALQSLSAPPRSSTSLHEPSSTSLMSTCHPARAQTRSIASWQLRLQHRPVAPSPTPVPCRRPLLVFPPSRHGHARTLAAQSVPVATFPSLGCADVSTCNVLGVQDESHAYASCYDLWRSP